MTVNRWNFDKVNDLRLQSYVCTLTGQGNMQWKDPVATPEDLPTTWSKVNDHRWCKSDWFVYKFDGEERAKVKVPWDWWVDTLAQLTDVSLADLTNGDALIFDETSTKFKNKAIFNPTITSPVEWQVLKFNGTTYVNADEKTELPTLPSVDGNYHLKCTVADGTATLSWEAQV